jgi:hypothetical protein
VAVVLDSDVVAGFLDRGDPLHGAVPDALILTGADAAAEVDSVVTADRQLGKVTGLDCQVRLLSAR